MRNGLKKLKNIVKRLIKMKNKIYLYADEAGNTGSDLFNDKNQPIFYTSVIFCKNDLDIDVNIKEDYQKICNEFLKSEVSEIHFIELSPEERKNVSKAMIELIKKYDLEVFISLIEKRYLPKLFFIDEFFDSGLNPKVPPEIYNVRMHRQILTFGIVNEFTDEDSEKFYKLFINQDKENLIEFIKDIIPKITKNKPKYHIELVNNALNYVIENIETFLFKMDKKRLLPNFHILSLIMHYSRKQFPNSEAIFKHDFNSNVLKGQPKKLLNQVVTAFDIETEDFSLITDMKKDDTFKNGINFIDSKDSIGIQIADFFVSSFRLYFEDKLVKEDNLELIYFIENQIPINGLSFKHTISEICKYDKYINKGN